MGTVLMLAAMAAFFWGILGLIKPRWSGLPSRWVAACLIGFSFVPVGISTEFYPEPGAEPSNGLTLGVVFMWGMCSLLVIGARTAIQWAHDRLRQHPAPEKSPQLSVTAEADALHRIGQNNRNVEAAEVKVVAPIQSPPTPSPAPQLSHVHQAVKGKRVTPALPRSRKANVPEESGDLPYIKPDHSAGWAGFITYEDAKGAISERRIVVRRIEGYGKAQTVMALCLERSASRRFLVSGIRELICAETGEVLDPKTHFDQLAQEGAIGVTDKSLADLVTILVFMARCDGDFHPVEMECIRRAVEAHIMQFGGDNSTIRKAANNAGKLAPDSDDFMAALSRIGDHPNRAALAALIIDAVEDVVEADGQILKEEEDWFQPVFDALERMAA